MQVGTDLPIQYGTKPYLALCSLVQDTEKLVHDEEQTGVEYDGGNKEQHPKLVHVEKMLSCRPHSTQERPSA